MTRQASRALVLILPIACLAAPAIQAQQGVLPYAVIRDSNMNVIGPVVGTVGADGPIIRIKNSGIPIFLEVVNDSQVLAIAETTYFENADCSGNAYHNGLFAEATDGFAALTGFAYSVARISGEQHLFRSAVGVTTADVNYESRFRSSLDGCDNISAMLNVGQDASSVLNLDNTYPPPYVME